MKILVGELIHEGNSFSVERITLEDFGPVYGDDVFAPDSRVRGGSAEGIINTLREAGVELVPAFFGNASADAALIYSDYENSSSLCAGPAGCGRGGWYLSGPARLNVCGW